MDNHTLYWYHLETHTDPYTEGYIGVTNDMSRRHNEHMRNSNGLFNHFYNAIEHYGKKAIKLTLLQTNLSEHKAYELEYLYRPEKNIGWNFAAGGEEVLVSLTTPVTLFHQSNPAKEYSFKSITEASKVLDIGRARISQALLRKNNIYGLDGWSVVHKNTDKASIITHGEAISKKLTGIKWKHPSPRKGKPFWTEEQKKHIGSFHKGKTISKEHVEKMRVHNRLNNPTCKEIGLTHISEPDKLLTYHSIAEASRQLNIPHSRLKSKCIRALGSFGNDGWAVMKLGSQDLFNEQVKHKALSRQSSSQLYL